MSVVVKVEDLSKRFRLGTLNRKTFFSDLTARLLGRKTVAEIPKQEEFWALRDVSFDVKDGEVLGILGRNGAGKSTLLKILSQITAPSTGRVLLKGRVASLLEVGTGFHQDLTGRDNVFLNGAILGMTRREIASKFDEIAEFSGVERFLDTPVKRYSSGMKVRLAFAVAAHLEPEILIIDEVLAVGDAAFQQKCVGKISDVARTGRTVLFVSHNAAAIESLCTRGIVLEQGQIKFDGTQSEAISFYSASYGVPAHSLAQRTDRAGNGDARIVAIELRDSAGRPLHNAHAGETTDLWFYFESHGKRTYPRLNLRINVATQLGAPVFTQSNQLAGQTFPALPERGAFVCRLPRLPLPEATYRVDYFLTSDYRQGDTIDQLTNAFDLHVENGDFFGSGNVPAIVSGVCLVEAKWRLEAEASPLTAAPLIALREA